MNHPLDHYLEPMRTNEEDVLSIEAYCIDGGNPNNPDRDMALHVGLANCHKCDYFRPNTNKVYLIEFTSIYRHQTATWGERNEILSHIPETAKNSGIRKLLFQYSFVNDNISKIYGTLLVLCWFAKQCKDAENAIKNKNYEFLLLVADRADIRVIDMNRSKLKNKAQGDKAAQFSAEDIKNPVEKKLKDKIIGITTIPKEARSRKDNSSLISNVQVLPYKNTEELEKTLKKFFPHDKPA